MKFAHLGDCHLGGWRQPELRDLNFQSFQEAIRRCITEKVDFILIAGDLFDSAYPPIETLKNTFDEFRKLKEKNIPVFLIAGSHDYSVSGKTFLDVLEKAGFCKNVALFEEKNSKLFLLPTIYKNYAIYGYPGKKSGLEVEEVEKIHIQDSPGMFRILMLHTALRDAVGESPIKSVNEKNLPKVDYIALGHLHINYAKNRIVYSGPTFPNSLSELEELKSGSFYIFENGKLIQQKIKTKEVLSIHLEITNALSATDSLMLLIEKEDVRDKIVIIRLSGILEHGKISDIDLQKVESALKNKGAFLVLRSTSKLRIAEPETELSLLNVPNIEEQLINKFKEKNHSKFNYLIPNLINALQIEKNEDEANSSFEERVLAETSSILPIELKNQAP